MTKNYYIGIDIGRSGAIAVINEGADVELLTDMPILAEMIDLTAIETTLSLYPKAKIIMERCQYTPIMKGAKSCFSFGNTYGSTVGLLTGLKRHFEVVRPQVWKKVFNLTAKDKEFSIAAARKLFPAVISKLLKSKDGRAEALLMAEYCRHTYSIIK